MATDAAGGQHLVITGANRGIGAELARQALARGDRVTVTVRDPNAPAVVELASLGGAAFTTLTADVTEPETLAAAAEQTAHPIDVLICNAGQFRGRGGMDGGDLGPDAWEATLMTNVAGVFFTIQAFLPHLRAAKAPRIAVVSSIMASSARAPGGSYIYRASKAAATNLARNLAQDLAGDGIAVGAYHPGWVRTDMGGSAADIDTGTAAAGLLARFDALGPASTGIFEDYRGEAIAF
ncbi:MAG: SDR family NAD(P)-dependent oxidoreductase [Pseudomonadota bacterium]